MEKIRKIDWVWVVRVAVPLFWGVLAAAVVWLGVDWLVLTVIAVVALESITVSVLFSRLKVKTEPPVEIEKGAPSNDGLRNLISNMNW